MKLFRFWLLLPPPVKGTDDLIIELQIKETSFTAALECARQHMREVKHPNIAIVYPEPEDAISER
ncbi:MAG: hypothetical protein KJ065_09210 [Anaerolineae bacterium]|nr:hypothetical protein [Anaerolineae bacterium]